MVIFVTVGCVLQHHITMMRRRTKLVQTPVHQALLGGTSNDAKAKSDDRGLGNNCLEGSANDSFADMVALDHKRPAKVNSSPSNTNSPSARGRRPRPQVTRTPNSVRGVTSPYLVTKSLQFRTPDTPRRKTEFCDEQKTQIIGQSPAFLRRADEKNSQQCLSKFPLHQAETISKMTASSGGQSTFCENVGLSESHANEIPQMFMISNHYRGALENIPMDLFKRPDAVNQFINNKYETGDMNVSFPLEKRPPVEGRDSLTNDKHIGSLTPDELIQSTSFVPPTRVRVAEIRDLRSSSESKRPFVESLSFEDDPEEGLESKNQATSPLSNCSMDFSPDIRRSSLFPDVGSPCSSLNAIVVDDFEYDDYVPQLPGSYFAMDPHAYTLTWSQHPPWVNQ